MIKTAKDSCHFDQIRTILVLYHAMPEEEFKSLKNLLKKLFARKQLDHIYYNPAKKYPEDFNYSVQAIYLSKGDFSFFGKLKNNTANLMLQKKHDLFLYIDFVNDRHIQKLIQLDQSKIKAGASSDELPNFDLSFQMEINSKEALIHQLVKYLKTI